MKRPFFLYPLLLLHLFLGFSAFAGGGMLLLKPDGSLLGMDTAWLDQSPFDSYLFPGLILFTLIGLFPLLTCVSLLLKPNWRWPNALNLYADRHWAWGFSLYSGSSLIIWITVQLILTDYFWLQPVMLFTGLLIMLLTLSPPVIKHFELPGQSN